MIKKSLIWGIPALIIIVIGLYIYLNPSLYEPLFSTITRTIITFVVIATVLILAGLIAFRFIRASRKPKRTERRSLREEREFLIWQNNVKGKSEDDLITCPYCKRRLPSDLLDVDHKMPLARGGTNELRNFHLVCRTCNVRKGAMTDKEFKARYKPSDLA